MENNVQNSSELIHLQSHSATAFSRSLKAYQTLRRRFIALCCLTLLVASVAAMPLASPATTQTAQTKQTQAPPTPQSIAAREAALVTEFDVNGLKVLVKHRANSQTVAAGLFLRGGSSNITDANAGIEALMLDAATEASQKHPRDVLRRELARMGTAVGSGVNYDYSVLTLATTRPNFDRSWDIFTDVALHPTFAPDDVARDQQRMVASLRDDTDTPDTYLQRLQERVAYANHPYRNRPQGTAETVAKLTPDDLRRYHASMMQTSRLLLVVVGDLDANALRARIADSFGKLPRGNYQSKAAPPLAFNAPTVDVTARGLPTNYIQGLFSAPSITSPDSYAMRVATSILRDRVFEEVRVKRNLSYAPDAFLGSQGANIGGLYVTAVDANQATSVMLNEVARLQRERVEPDDITAIVSQFLTRYYMDEETNAAQAGELARYELIGGGWRNSLDIIERLRSVTPADVQRVARTYLRNIRFVVLGDPKSIDPKVFTTQTSE